MFEALRREVLEETALQVTHIEGHDTRVVCAGEQAVVECVQPLAAYQTVQGPVASLGLYFRCHARGTLRPQIGESGGAGWHSNAELHALLDGEPESLSWLDRAGRAQYLVLAASQ